MTERPSRSRSRLSTRPTVGCAALGRVLFATVFATAFGTGCSEPADTFKVDELGKGPGQMVGNDGPLNSEFGAGPDQRPEARQTDPPQDKEAPDCGQDCLKYCENLDLKNPVDRGLCPSLWGVGLQSKPVDKTEACRRVYADMIGRFPSRDEVRGCKDRPWAKTVRQLISTDRFVRVNQRRWADKLLYNNEAISIVRIFDADDLVGKMYRGAVPYDQFAAVISAHPVITRRYSTAGDRAEAVFELLMGRPPLGSERSDLARLYNLWDNGYHDHKRLGTRLPDAYIEFECLTDSGEVDPRTKGECTSILWGYRELILEPDLRAEEDDGNYRMWAGQLRPEEWRRLQMPGKILSEQPAFWEHAVDDVLKQYLGYDLGRKVPQVRQQLVDHFLAHDADMRSLHFAVATSIAYRQSAAGDAPSSYRWTWGPLKQVHAEVWIDSIKEMTGYDLSRCDHRIPEPGRLERNDSLASRALLKHSRWEIDEEGEVDDSYKDLARSLGGCPQNEVGGRFRIISILTTAQQLNFVEKVCNPSMEGDDGAELQSLLPGGVDRDKAVTPDIAAKIVKYQTKKFFGRSPTDQEMKEAREHGEACSRSVCNAEEFARPSCFALLSSSEMLFY